MEDERVSIGHEFGNMIKGCSFKGLDCLEERYVNELEFASPQNISLHP